MISKRKVHVPGYYNELDNFQKQFSISRNTSYTTFSMGCSDVKVNKNNENVETCIHNKINFYLFLTKEMSNARSLKKITSKRCSSQKIIVQQNLKIVLLFFRN